MAQAVSIKKEELENISRIMMQRKGDVIKVHHYPEFHLFFAFDPLNEKDLHVMDINTVGPMIDYYLGEGYRITEIKKLEDEKIIEKEVAHVDDLFEKMDYRNQLDREIIGHQLKGNTKEAIKIIESVFDDRNTLEIKIGFFQNDFVKTWMITRVNNISWRINGDEENIYSSEMIIHTLYGFIEERKLTNFKVN